MSHAAFTLEAPVRQRRHRFPMTALADAMFQLLIFFMLASSLTPYSLLPLQNGAAPVEVGTGGTDPAQAPASPSINEDSIVWTVSTESVAIGGQDFAFDRLGALARALGTPALPADVIVLVSDDATIQDLTTVLEALRLGDVASVRIATSGGTP